MSSARRRRTRIETPSAEVGSPEASVVLTEPSPRRRRWAPIAGSLGIVLAIVGAAAFATKGIVVKLALAEGIDSLTTLTWRMIVAVPVFATVGIVGVLRHRDARTATGERVLDVSSALQAAGVGMIGYYLASLLDFSALEFISAQLDRLILLLYPFFVVLFGVVFFRRRVTRVMIVGQVLSYLGIAVIFWRDLSFAGEHVLFGSMLVLGAAVAYAVYQILAKPLIDRMGAGLFTSIAMSGAGIAIFVHFALTHPIGELAVPADAWPLVIAIGLVSTVLPSYSISAAIGMIGSERTAVIGNVSPVITIVFAVWLLGEPFTVWHAVGTALVLVGAWIFAMPRAAR
ncbi:DMT family transporter [Agromyces endophyticus]|uniref:DMT family transporter n=1 Tax=Agromyces sp. H17E-10 TaxID=2932244 RepID=UPI001FD1D272|nr:DMT family transporter [Agromyces sp. H17E-10]UOQ90838.1 DMT family transporter [Agromyces sp. H17E-10]